MAVWADVYATERVNISPVDGGAGNMKKIHNGELFNQTAGLDVTATGGYSARKQPIKSRLGEALLGSWNPAGSIPLDQAVDAAAGRGRGTEPGGGGDALNADDLLATGWLMKMQPFETLAFFGLTFELRKRNPP